MLIDGDQSITVGLGGVPLQGPPDASRVVTYCKTFAGGRWLGGNPFGSRVFRW